MNHPHQYLKLVTPYKNRLMETKKDTTQEETVYFEDLDLSDEVLDALYDIRFEK